MIGPKAGEVLVLLLDGEVCHWHDEQLQSDTPKLNAPSSSQTQLTKKTRNTIAFYSKRTLLGPNGRHALLHALYSRLALHVGTTRPLYSLLVLAHVS